MRYLAIASAAALLAMPVQATTITDPFSSFWVLGDSLSDNQNAVAMALTINAQQDTPIVFPPASPLQQPGVASDGFTWAKRFNDAFAAAGKATANLSFADARATENGVSVPDLAAQIDAESFFDTSFSFNLNPAAPEETTTIAGTAPKYIDGQGGLLDRKGDWGSDPLVTVFIGGNDFLDTSLAIATGGVSPEVGLASVVANTFASVSSNINGLVDEGVNDFLIMNLPNFAAVPQFDGAGAALGIGLSNAAMQYNNLLELYIEGLQAAGVNVSYVDFFSALSDTDRLAAAGITDFEDACLFSVDPSTADCTGFLYFDNLHPTGAAHGVLADLAAEAISDTYGLQPIPLPAPALMLLTALGGTLLMRRRKTAT